MSDFLRREIHQKRPFGSLEEEAFLNLQRTAGILFQELARFLKPYRLTPTQYNALRILRGSHPESLACREVGRRMVTPVPDVTRLLDRLERQGAVERVRDPEDRRVVRVRVSYRGLEMLEELDGPLDSWVRKRLSVLGEEELRLLVDSLGKLRVRHS